MAARTQSGSAGAGEAVDLILSIANCELRADDWPMAAGIDSGIEAETVALILVQLSDCSRGSDEMKHGAVI